ncbi:MAG: hypothetical protein VSS75_030865 [Candidatus Parabeggiatoa sp.]|nr:hypothetical protein [Candidatus Parabeggiatoa sp.]
MNNVSMSGQPQGIAPTINFNLKKMIALTKSRYVFTALQDREGPAQGLALDVTDNTLAINH